MAVNYRECYFDEISYRNDSFNVALHSLIERSVNNSVRWLYGVVSRAKAVIWHLGVVQAVLSIDICDRSHLRSRIRINPFLSDCFIYLFIK